MDTDRFNPAARIIEMGGGDAAVAQDAGCDRSVVTRWRLPRASGGGGGIIPAKYHLRLLVRFRARGIDLRPADFLDLSEFRDLPHGLPPLGIPPAANDNLRPAANDNLPAQIAPKAEA
jgi:hypothetical protein